ncbi:DNA-processing protein DprA [Azovibrio restrictus]|uniref:DNA-processing protein DprA n=1 Tax=Azovibrio restrictus TaxID=146938 RepID=UPI0026ED7727|nr:DNA-processing protein DprA [Azovibrio restrictus]
MTPSLSPNTQAILLLTAPLIAGRSSPSPDLLSPGDYKRLARHLREMERQPADLLSPDAADLLRACRPVIEESRLQRLLGRGFLLSQVIERWQARAIWVVSRADADYPRRIKARLREDAPPVLYGCGDINLLDSGGLAVVGSRHVDDALIDYTMSIGRLAARAHTTLISGGARGIDQAAMRGALEAGGMVSGVLADSLEKTAMNREHRNLLLDGQLVLLSPYDPSAGFNVGNAMQRNKLIYALADAALVVSSDLDKGGTWAGATEQLDKLNLVPVYVRSTGAPSAGLEALRKKGALPWPDPRDVDGFGAVFEVDKPKTPADKQAGLSLFSNDNDIVSMPGAQQAIMPEIQAEPDTEKHAEPPVVPTSEIPGIKRVEETPPSAPPTTDLATAGGDAATPVNASPADTLLSAVREVIQRLLVKPMKEAEVASALDVSNAQAKAWLQRLADEGLLEKQKKPAGYVIKQSRLFD